MKIAKSILTTLKKHSRQIRDKGAFVFDIDQTLLPPDEGLDRYPAVRRKIVELLRRGLCIAFISGGPGAVAKNRVLTPLFHEAGSDLQCFKRLSFYVNGGGSKFLVSEDGALTEDRAFAQKNRIDGKHILAVQKILQDYVERKFDLEKRLWVQVLKAWKKKRDAQWNGLSIEFDDSWISGKPWQISFLEDSKMADIKAAKNSGRTTFPFINTRLMSFDSKGKISGVAGFTPTGFYPLSKSKGDALDLDLRDQIISHLKKELGKRRNDLVFRKAGRSSIDITKKGTDKAACLKDLIKFWRLAASSIYYFGDEFHPGGNDEPIVSDAALVKRGINILAFNPEKAPNSTKALWVGKNVQAVHKLLLELA